MKRQILICAVLAVFFAAVLCPLRAYGVTPLDPEAETSLTLRYQKEEQAFSDLSISIYRVAEAFADGTFALTAPYDTYPVNIHGITAQEQWKHVAATLEAYMIADRLAPYRQESTDSNGVAAFTRLETGLYLVSGAVAENNSGTYVFAPFMVYLPTPQQDGSFDYTVEAIPKCVEYVPKTVYSVTKLWQDAGKQADRPEAVTVDIYRDGALQETQILNGDNNWSYTWYVSAEDQGKWTVTERTSSDTYTVTVQQSGSSFSLVNTHKSVTDIPDSPQTGDTFHVPLYILLMCISGMMLILLGLYGRRRSQV